MSKDNYRLSRLGVLAPAALSACMDASVLAVPTAGAIVSTVLKELSKAFMLKKWFHGSLTAKEAEHLLMEKGKSGSFLVRESRSHPGDFVLSVRARSHVTHVMVRKQSSKYDVGTGEQFDDLVGLIEHFRSYPMIEESGEVLKLQQPISGAYLRPKYIGCTTNETEEQADNKSDIYDFEFKSLEYRDNPREYTTLEGNKGENIKKNRYRNVVPYDQTRVILQNGDGSNNSDYVNANYINAYNLSDLCSSAQSSTESLDSVRSLKLRKRTKFHLPLVSKSLSDDALRDLKRSLKKNQTTKEMTAENVNKRIYIATQGCLSNTKEDFWRMIFQEDTRMIVMIAKEFENGKKKCEKYWPDLDKEESFGNLIVKSMSETFKSEYVIRELQITDDKNNSRYIFQYQYIAWPDHGTPEKPNGVLDFLIDINDKMKSIMEDVNKPEQNKLCVHCSAGIGRTGTFIVLDMIINEIKVSGSNNKIEISNAVMLVRSQRSGMVQNKYQYKFLYQVIKEYIQKYT